MQVVIEKATALLYLRSTCYQVFETAPRREGSALRHDTIASDRSAVTSFSETMTRESHIALLAEIKRRLVYPLIEYSESDAERSKVGPNAQI